MMQFTVTRSFTGDTVLVRVLEIESKLYGQFLWYFCVFFGAWKSAFVVWEKEACLFCNTKKWKNHFEKWGWVQDDTKLIYILCQNCTELYENLFLNPWWSMFFSFKVVWTCLIMGWHSVLFSESQWMLWVIWDYFYCCITNTAYSLFGN